MNLFRLLSKRFSRPTASAGTRTLPEPARVNLADQEVHDEHFVRLPEWSSYTPAPPVWQMPDAGAQRARIEALVAQHAQRGTLDGLVPDLLDREIHHEMEEVRTALDGAHTEAQAAAQRMWEQAKLAQVAAGREVANARERLSEAEDGYAHAYLILTGRMPARRAEPITVAPASITTEVAPIEPVTVTKMPTPDPEAQTSVPTPDDVQSEADLPAPFHLPTVTLASSDTDSDTDGDDSTRLRIAR